MFSMVLGKIMMHELLYISEKKQKKHIIINITFNIEDRVIKGK